MKVVGHRQGKSQLQDHGNYQKFTAKKQKAPGTRKQQQSSPRTQEPFQPAGNDSKIKPELHERGREREIVPDGIQVSKSPPERLGCPLQHWSADGGDDQNTQEAELEAGAGQGTRVYQQKGESCCSDRVEDCPPAIKSSCAQVKCEHQRGSPYRRAHTGQKGIRDR